VAALMPKPVAWDDLVHSPLEREIMKQVLFWHPKAKAVRDGERWIVWSLDELRDKVQLGPAPADRSLTRCLTHLRDVGLLITKRHRHPFKAMRGPVLWLRPDVEGAVANLAATCPKPGGKLAATNIQTTVVQSSEEQISGKPQAPQPPASEDDEMQGGDFLKKAGKKLLASEVWETVSSKNGPQDYPIVAKPEIAHKALRDACIANGYPSPGSFGKKRGGQMKTMLRRFKEEGVGENKAGELIFFIASKWSEFKGWMKATFGTSVVGTAPNHDALTQHAVEAVGFWKTYTTVIVVAEDKPSEHGSSFDEGL
jgi:hypothetical protein